LSQATAVAQLCSPANSKWPQECKDEVLEISVLLSGDFVRFKIDRFRCCTLLLPLLLLGAAFGQGEGGKMKEDAPVQFVSMFSSDADVNVPRTPCQRLRDMADHSGAATDMAGERPAVCDQVLDIIAGKAGLETTDALTPIRAEKITVDSSLRVLITEPSTRSIHILDFANRKHSRIDGAKDDRMTFPFGIATDASNRIYVTDLKRGRIAVYRADGKFEKFIGNLMNEGLFQRPQSIAIDRAKGRIYIADTERNFVLILTLDGRIVAQIGKRGGGSGPAEFLEPVEIALYENEVFVLDKRNNRIQVLSLDGRYRRQFKLEGSGVREANGIAFDTQGRLFVPSLNWVEVFNREGQLLYRFGQSGELPGEFKMTMSRGICTDSKDRVYVTDSGNRRIQVFQVAEDFNSKTEASR
jgi:DNA-binding beta-propeller fold protein YncE